MNPLKLASIRDGVADLGITTHPFLSARQKKTHINTCFPGKELSAGTYATKLKAHLQA